MVLINTMCVVHIGMSEHIVYYAYAHVRTELVNLLKSKEFINQFIIFNDNLFGKCVQTFPIKNAHDHSSTHRHAPPQPI